MTLKTIIMKIEHQLFAHHYILSGDKEKAYKIAYPNAEGEPMKNAARRLINTQEVRDYITTRMTELQQNAANASHEEQKRQEEQEYATLLLKRKTLRHMIDGERKQLRHFRFKDHIETIEEELSPFVILRAIELDTKLAAEWYSRAAKGQPVTPPAEKKEKKYVNFDEVLIHKYGPDYLPGLRAQTVRDNPRMAEEYARDGLRVLDYIPDASHFKRMEEEQTKRLAELEEAYNKIRPEEEQHDPPAIKQTPPPPATQNNTKPTVSCKLKTIVPQKHITQVNRFANHPAPPFGVNPMSIVQPCTRIKFSPEEIQRRINEDYEQLRNNPDSIFYNPTHSETG